MMRDVEMKEVYDYDCVGFLLVGLVYRYNTLLTALY